MKKKTFGIVAGAIGAGVVAIGGISAAAAHLIDKQHDKIEEISSEEDNSEEE